MASNIGRLIVVHNDFCEEIKRIKKVSDMMCSMHSVLRDRYHRRAFWIDIALMASSVWLLSMVFVEPTIGKKLSPPYFDTNIWIGLLSITTFFFSVIQFKVNWKEVSEAHRRSADFYSAIKRECTYLISQYDTLDINKCKHLLDRYDSSGDICIPIPEKDFLSLKKYHKQKIFISKYADENPWVSIHFLRLMLWWKDNKKIRVD